MKRKQIISAILIMAALLSAFVLPAAAKENTPGVITTEVEILPNGDRIETELITYDQPEGAKTIAGGQKTKSYKNSSGAVMWTVTVYGTFNYTGSYATCTSATCSTTCTGSGWSIVSSSASKSGNTAMATATAKHNYNGITYNRTLSVVLSCNPNGLLS